MCGIAGVKRFGDAPITADELGILLCALEHRGNSATGIAIQNADEPQALYVHKEATPAFSFIATKAYKDFLEEHLKPSTVTVLLHTRAATVGSPRKNENNHPIYAGQTAIVHNGGIGNHEYVFKDLKTERSCETDSDVIRAVLDKYGFTRKGVSELCKLSGSGAIAAIQVGLPGYLLLGRSGNPLIYGDYNDKLYFASEFQAIQKAARPWIQRHGLTMRMASADGVAFFSMPDNSAYLIGPKNMEWHQELRINTTTFLPHTYRVNDNYAAKRSVWLAKEREEKRVARQTPIQIDGVVVAEKDAVEDAGEHRQFVRKGKKIRNGSKGKEVGMCPNCHTANAKKHNEEAWAEYFCFKCKHGLEALDK